jgi:hypothetical protein
MKCAIFILSAALASPLYPITLVDINASWSVTEIATGNVICSGEHDGSESLIGDLCAGAIPGLDGIHVLMTATAADDPTPSADVFTQVAIMGAFDTAAFDVAFESFVFAEATTIAQITGGTGPGLIQWIGSEILGGGPVISGSTFVSVCDPSTGGGICFALEPFVFGDIVTATTAASLSIGPLHNAGATFGGNANATILGSLLDLNEIPIPGEFTPVPEPATWLLSLAAGALIHIGRKRLS